MRVNSPEVFSCLKISAQEVIQALRNEMISNARSLNILRVAIVSLTLLTFIIFGWILKDPEWQGGDIPTAIYLLFSIILCYSSFRNTRVAEQSGLALAFLDIPGLAAMELCVLPGAKNPAELVSFYSSFYVIIIVGSFLWMTPRFIISAAAAAIVFESMLQIHAGLSHSAIVSTATLYLVAATISIFGGIRLKKVVKETTARLLAQRQAEESYEASQASFQKLIAHLPDGVLVCRDSRIVYVNEQLTTILGYKNSSDLIGLLMLDLVHKEDRSRLEQAITEACRGIGPTMLLESRFLKSDGPSIFAETRCVQVLIEGGKAILTVVRDLTERKKMQEQIMLSERMASMGTLAAGVGHEINNPLTSLIYNLDFVASEMAQLRDRPADRTAINNLQENMSDALEAAHRIREIARDLKLFSRSDGEVMAPQDLHSSLDSALRIAQNEIIHRATLIKRYEPVPLVMANESRLGQLFLNLIVNAAQSIPEGNANKNKITIVTRTDREGRAIVEVHDTGLGISLEELPKIFDPFFTTKPINMGTGLGLSICQRIVAALAGTIEAESTKGQGSIFRVILPPAAPGAVQAEKPLETPAFEISRSRILVIDDEPSICKMIKRILGKQHDVTTFINAQEALTMIKSGQRFDVILCDLMMPNLTGMDLFAQISGIAPDQGKRMIFLSGGAFTPSAREFLVHSPNPHLEKPFEPGQLEKTISDLIASL